MRRKRLKVVSITSESDVIQRHRVATLQGGSRNYFSVSGDIHCMPLIFT